MTFLRIFWFSLILFSFHASASQHLDTSRLIIGFHEADYMSLGGAAEATDYINSHWGDKQMIILVRPMGNSTILVELVEADVASLNKVINDLSQMPKIRFVDKEQMAEHFPASNLSIPSIN